MSSKRLKIVFKWGSIITIVSYVFEFIYSLVLSFVLNVNVLINTDINTIILGLGLIILTYYFVEKRYY